jgi:sodium-dependent dicarboxylate transporter 2/3/5
MNNTTQATVGAPAKVEQLKSLSEEWRRIAFAILGIALFALFYFLPELPPAIDPSGKAFELSREAQLSIGLFLLAGIWWVFEVIPIGVTSLTIGVVQAAFMIAPATHDYFPPPDSPRFFHAVVYS